MKKLAEYRLIHLQPSPEDGERICIAILFVEDSRSSLVFDAALRRARCLGDKLDLDYVRSLLSYTSRELIRRESPLSWLASILGAQFHISAPRQVIAPVSDVARQLLLDKFVTKKGEKSEGSLYEQKFGAKVQELLLKTYHRDLQVIFGAEPKTVLGRPTKQLIKPVAVAINSDSKSLLVDGVDLNLLSPKRAIQRVGRVSHTFWQYSKLRNQRHLARDLQRVAMLFNGVPRQDISYKDAHDYAIEQLQAESDIFIDTTSLEGTERFEELVSAM